LKSLGIDTSTTIFSICLCEDEKIFHELRCERSFYKNSRDAGFFNTVENLIKSLDNAHLDAIALTLGPGMFTSLRVGLAFAKGLYFSQNIPLYGVNTLEVIAKSFPVFDFVKGNQNKTIVAAVLEAFQKEFFVAFYNSNSRIGDDLLITPEGFVSYVYQKFKKDALIVAIGPGIQILKENKIIKKNLQNTNRLIMLDSDLYFPSASKVVKVALPRIRSKKYDNPDLLEPYYIKKTSAEIKAGN